MWNWWASRRVPEPLPTQGLCDAIVNMDYIVKKRCDEVVTAQKEAVELGGCPLPALSEDVLFEVELEDMCEQDPTVWEDLANRRWEESTSYPGETRDSTTGEMLDPAKVNEGCEEEMEFMSQMHVWDRVTREEARNDPEGNM